MIKKLTLILMFLFPFACANENKYDNMLFTAVKAGDIITTENILKKGIDLNKKNKISETPLMIAAKYCHLNIVKLLLKNNAKPNVKDKKGRTVLNRVFCNTNIELTKILLKYGADINTRDKSGDTPLHKAASCRGNVKFVQYLNFLIQNRARVNGRNNEGETPVFWAIASGAINNVKILVENGADLNIKNNKNQTPLEYVKNGNHFAKEKIVKKIISILKKHSINQ